METINIKQTTVKLVVSESVVESAELTKACINGLQANDIAATNVKITDANLSDLEIQYAQLGGAYIHDIGLPPSGHPHYVEGAKQRPLRFEHCDLNKSTFTNCDLSGVAITDSNLSGMTINGVLVDELLKAYGITKK